MELIPTFLIYLFSNQPIEYKRKHKIQDTKCNVQDVNLEILYYTRMRNVKNILFEKNIFIYRLIWLVSYLVTWLDS